MLLQNDGKLE